MSFKYEHIMKLGDRFISPNNLVDIDSDEPYVYLEMTFHRYFDNLKPNAKPFPYHITAHNHKELNNEIQELMKFASTPRTVGGYKQYRCGYIVLLYNGETKDYKLIHKLEYLGTVSEDIYNDHSYRPKNLLDGFRDVLVAEANPDIYDFQLIFLFGDQLDYFNGYKILYNERDMTQKKLFLLNDDEGYYPLNFFKRASSRLNIDNLERESYKTLVDGHIMSRPADNFLTYIGKYLIKDGKFIEEYFMFDHPDEDNGTYHMKMTLTKYSDVLEDYDNIVNPFENTYHKSDKDRELESTNNADILFGFHHTKPLNKFKIKYIETEPVDITSKGINYSKRDLMYIYPVSDKSTPHFEVCSESEFGEIKKEDQ